jgi:hypothetical protein
MRQTTIVINVHEEYFEGDFLNQLAHDILEELGEWQAITTQTSKDPLLGVGTAEVIRLPK